MGDGDINNLLEEKIIVELGKGINLDDISFNSSDIIFRKSLKNILDNSLIDPDLVAESKYFSILPWDTYVKTKHCKENFIEDYVDIKENSNILLDNIINYETLLNKDILRDDLKIAYQEKRVSAEILAKSKFYSILPWDDFVSTDFCKENYPEDYVPKHNSINIKDNNDIDLDFISQYKESMNKSELRNDLEVAYQEKRVSAEILAKSKFYSILPWDDFVSTDFCKENYPEDYVPKHNSINIKDNNDIDLDFISQYKDSMNTSELRDDLKIAYQEKRVSAEVLAKSDFYSILPWDDFVSTDFCKENYPEDYVAPKVVSSDFELKGDFEILKLSVKNEYKMSDRADRNLEFVDNKLGDDNMSFSKKPQPLEVIDRDLTFIPKDTKPKFINTASGDILGQISKLHNILPKHYDLMIPETDFIRTYIDKKKKTIEEISNKKNIPWTFISHYINKRPELTKEDLESAFKKAANEGRINLDGLISEGFIHILTKEQIKKTDYYKEQLDKKLEDFKVLGIRAISSDYKDELNKSKKQFDISIKTDLLPEKYSKPNLEMTLSNITHNTKILDSMSLKSESQYIESNSKISKEANFKVDIDLGKEQYIDNRESLKLITPKVKLSIPIKKPEKESIFSYIMSFFEDVQPTEAIEFSFKDEVGQSLNYHDNFSIDTSNLKSDYKLVTRESSFKILDKNKAMDIIKPQIPTYGLNDMFNDSVKSISSICTSIKDKFKQTTKGIGEIVEGVDFQSIKNIIDSNVSHYTKRISQNSKQILKSNFLKYASIAVAIFNLYNAISPRIVNENKKTKIVVQQIAKKPTFNIEQKTPVITKKNEPQKIKAASPVEYEEAPPEFLPIEPTLEKYAKIITDDGFNIMDSIKTIFYQDKWGHSVDLPMMCGSLKYEEPIETALRYDDIKLNVSKIKSLNLDYHKKYGNAANAVLNTIKLDKTSLSLDKLIQIAVQRSGFLPETQDDIKKYKALCKKVKRATLNRLPKKYRKTVPKGVTIDIIVEDNENRLLSNTDSRIFNQIVDYDKVRITDPYGIRPVHPVTGKKNVFHSGVDLGVPSRTKVRSPVDGEVVYAGWKRGYGKIITIKDKNGIESSYAHLRRFKVRKYQKIKKGQYIAQSGSTGTGTGQHLHFEVRKDGKTVNPLPYLINTYENMGNRSAIISRVNVKPVILKVKKDNNKTWLNKYIPLNKIKNRIEVSDFKFKKGSSYRLLRF